MDVQVLLDDECDDPPVHVGGPESRPLAYVRGVPLAGDVRTFGAPRAGVGREVITLCGDVGADGLALALAAALESRRAPGCDVPGAVRYLGVWAEAGAVGDVAWRDRDTGQLHSADLAVAASTLRVNADRLLVCCGALLRQTTAKLSMADWPEGVRRAISFSFTAPDDLQPFVGDDVTDQLLASLREADGDAGAYAETLA